MRLNEGVRKIKKRISEVLSEEEKAELRKWAEESEWVRNSTLSIKEKLSKLIEIAAEHEAMKNVFNLFWRNVKKSFWNDREFATRSAVIGMAVGISFGLFLGVGIAAVAIGGLSGAGVAMVASVTVTSFLLTAGGGALIGGLIGELIKSEEKRQLESGVLGKDEVFDEVVKEYYESGKLKAEGIHANGEANGWSKEYYESGQLKSDGVYKGGEPNGIFREYYESGQLKAEGVYVDGEPDGMLREYYESGQLKSEGVYRNGMPVGKGKTYDEEGNSRP